MEKLDRELLQQVKEAFVPMPKGAMPAPPVAGAGMMTQAQVSPMGPPPDMGMGGGVPMGGGAPMAGGGIPPVDPAMMGAGGMPPEGGGEPSLAPAGGELPPELMAALTGDAGAGAGSGEITMDVEALGKLLATVVTAATQKAPRQPKPEEAAQPAMPAPGVGM